MKKAGTAGIGLVVGLIIGCLIMGDSGPHHMLGKFVFAAAGILVALFLDKMSDIH